MIDVDLHDAVSNRFKCRVVELEKAHLQAFIRQAHFRDIGFGRRRVSPCRLQGCQHLLCPTNE